MLLAATIDEYKPSSPPHITAVILGDDEERRVKRGWRFM